jgi:hypothetical protein
MSNLRLAHPTIREQSVPSGLIAKRGSEFTGGGNFFRLRGGLTANRTWVQCSGFVIGLLVIPALGGAGDTLRGAGCSFETISAAGRKHLSRSRSPNGDENRLAALELTD